MSDNIKVSYIKDDGFDYLFSQFDQCVNYVNELEIPIKLKGYGYLLRIALNAIKDEQFEALLMRLENNKELERNEGGYEDFGDNDPKEALFNLIRYLKEHNLKFKKIKDTIGIITERSYLVAEREDVILLNKIINIKYKVITHTELNKHIRNRTLQNRLIIFYSFNGSKDFDFIYNMPNNIRLLLYSSEKDLYNRQLQIYKEQLENELTSEVRLLISGVDYKKNIEEEVKVSPTLQQTIARLEELSKTGYAGYKDESDMALDDLEDKITYEITFSDNSVIKIESNETVFNDKGNLVKSWRLKIGDIVQIYPKELADNLYQVAVDQEPDIFGEIDIQSKLWQSIIKTLHQHFNDKDILYIRLKDKGLKVLQLTINAYFDGQRKFPMYNTDICAICSLADEVLENKNHVKDIYPKIKQSKRLYNSTMIVLGRGVKQELKQFLKDQTIGEILKKKAFTKEILKKFIEDYMPLLEITNIEEVNDEQ